VRPFGKLVYLMPAYVISEADLQQLGNRLVATLQALSTRN
jgi:adenosylmethionine-8-amino-7-oxononanoate aminotransferase